MQLFARNDQNCIVAATEAAKESEYFCLECGSAVRMRGGRFRRNHFYHIAPDRKCRQSGKSLTHLQVQCKLRDAIPGYVDLERRFEEIGRIADVVWESEKLIFEVQCSPISTEEVEARNRDYHSVGYKVVWILHDKTFNRYRVTAAEEWLRTSPHYYTNIDSEGVGKIYDQLSLVAGGIRKRKLLALSIDVTVPCSFSDANLGHAFLSNRSETWHTYFRGDACDLVMRGAALEEVRKALEAMACDMTTDYEGWKAFGPMREAVMFFARGYEVLLRMFVEKACR